MKIVVKEFSALMELKNEGIALEVRDPQEELLGSLVVNKSQLIWSKGKTKRDKGIKVSWKDFIAFVESRTAKAAPKKASMAKKAVPVKKKAVTTKAASAKKASAPLKPVAEKAVPVQAIAKA